MGAGENLLSQGLKKLLFQQIISLNRLIPWIAPYDCGVHTKLSL